MLHKEELNCGIGCKFHTFPTNCIDLELLFDYLQNRKRERKMARSRVVNTVWWS